MAVINYFSGTEGDSHFNACVDAGVTNVLTSFLYLKKRKDFDIVKRRKKANPHMNWLIDSGAHTFITTKDVYGGWSITTWEEYLDEYTSWLRDNRKYIAGAVELDIDYLVGPSIVEKWQKQYFLPLVEEGIDICFCWHDERGMDGWEDMCSRFSYVGLPGEFSKEKNFTRYIAIAKKYTTRIHGFAATKQADFRDWPWYSVDSITWKHGEISGVLLDWDERTQKFKQYGDKDKRPLLRQKYIDNGFDADAIIDDTNYKEVTKYCLWSMSEMEKFYVKRFSDRIFYYELRLPHPRAVLQISQQRVRAYWKKFRPSELFEAHAEVNKIGRIRGFLFAIACVQYRELGLLKVQHKEFLATYFKKHMDSAKLDPITLQKEVSLYISPPNPKAIARTEREHFEPTDEPKSREPSLLDEEDEFEDLDYTLLFDIDELEDEIWTTRLPLLTSTSERTQLTSCD